jgi:hypothetical protein
MIWLTVLPVVALWLFFESRFKQMSAGEIFFAPFALLLHVAAQLCLEVLAIAVTTLAYASIIFTTIIHCLGYYYEYRNKQRSRSGS